jgi:HEAT repeat protein
MSKKLQSGLAALIWLSACGGGDPKGKPAAKVQKSPHADEVVAAPRELPASVPTDEAAKEVLQEMFEDKNPGMKIMAVRAWSGLTGPASDMALRKALYESDALVHTIAAASLAQRGDFTGMPLMEEALQKEVNGATGIVITSLRRINKEKSVPVLQKCIASESVGLLASCAAALSYLGDEKGNAMLAALSKTPVTAAEMAKNLRFIQEPQALVMLDALMAQDDNYNNAKALALVAVSSFGPAADEHFQKALSSTSPLVKGIAAAILLSRGIDADPNLVAAAIKTPQGPKVFSVLGGRVKKPDSRILPVVWLVLRGEPEGFPFAFQVLGNALKNGAKPTDLTALYALLDAVPNLTGNFTVKQLPKNAPMNTSQPTSKSASQPTSKSASQPTSLKKLSEGESQKLRAAQGAATLAAAYLSVLGDKRGLETMEKLLFWPNPSPAWVPAIEALQGDAAYPIVLIAAKHPSADVRVAAIPALVEKVKAGDKDAYAILKNFGSDEAPNVRQAMLKHLSLLSEADAEPIARRALTDRLYAVRLTAAIAVLSQKMQPTAQPDEE